MYGKNEIINPIFRNPGSEGGVLQRAPLKIKTSHGTTKRTGIALKHHGVSGIDYVLAEGGFQYRAIQNLID